MSTPAPFDVRRTVRCPAGLHETAVPVLVDGKPIAVLRTGQVFQKKATPAQFDKVAKLADTWGLAAGISDLRDAFYMTTVLSAEVYGGWIKLLTIFAQYLAAIAKQMITIEEKLEPPIITKAKQFIQDYQTDQLSLDQVAKSVNTSRFYFCKIFKKSTGMNFTDYVVRVRIDRASNLLLNRELRISEIGFEVGFQSLTHFNRAFRRVTNQAPTEYRNRLPSALLTRQS